MTGPLPSSRGPVPSPEAIRPIVQRLVAHHPAMLRRSVESIIHSLCLTARGYLDGSDANAAVAVEQLPRLAGYSSPVVRQALIDAFTPWTPAGFRRWIASELGEVPMAGPRLVVQVLAGNVPTAGLRSLAAALLLRSCVLVKPSSDEPLLPALFVDSLARHDPELARAVAVVHWPGGHEPVEQVVFDMADVVEVFGSEATLAGIRPRLPRACRFIGHGHKVSFAVVRADAAGPPEAAAVAHDAAMYDQRGCLCPQAVFVLGADRAQAEVFGGLLAEALADLEQTCPAGPRPAGLASAVQQLRARYEVQPGARVWASPHSTAWTVILLPAETLPPAGGARTLFVCPVSSPERLAALLAPVAGHVQALGLGPGLRWETLGLGFSPWCCPLGQMQRPPLDWPEDGQRLLRQLAGL